MNNFNASGWTPWGAGMAAITLVTGLLKTVLQNERDPVIRGVVTILAISIAPLVIIGFVIISFLLALFRNRKNN